MSRVRQSVAVALAAAMLAACGQSSDDVSAPDRLRDRLEELDGVAQVEVEVTGADETEFGDEYVEVDVEMEDDSSVDEVHTLLEEMGDGTPLDQDQLVQNTVDRGSSHLVVRDEEGEAVTRQTLAERLVAVDDDLGKRVAFIEGDDGSVEVQLGEDPSTDDITEAAEAVRDSEELRDVAGWELPSSDAGVPWYDAELHVNGLLTEQVLEDWRSLVASAELAPGGELTQVKRLQVVHPADEVDLSVGVLLEGVSPEELTPAAYGDQLWPMLRQQLDILRTMPDGSTLSVINGDSDRFLEVELGSKRAARDPHGRTWNQEALAYLAGQ